MWTDQGVDCSRYDLVVVRSTWDYHAAARRVPRLGGAGGRGDDRWRTRRDGAGVEHRQDLSARARRAGLPVVDTTWLGPATRSPCRRRRVRGQAGVSAGSRDTNRYVAGDHDELRGRHARSLLEAGRTVMVQPYLARIDTAGETAMLYFGGEFSHAVRKAPLLEPGCRSSPLRSSQSPWSRASRRRRRAGRGRSGARRAAVDAARARARRPAVRPGGPRARADGAPDAAGARAGRAVDVPDPRRHRTVRSLPRGLRPRSPARVGG